MFLLVNDKNTILEVYKGDAYTTRDNGAIDFADGSGLSRLRSGSRLIAIPNQDLSEIHDEYGYQGSWPDDVPLKYTAQELASIADIYTGRRIELAVHEYCGSDEQFGILREQIARMLNGDMTASDDFARFNKIAIAEIEKARIEKEAL